MTASTGRGRGAPRVAQWRKETAPIWRAPAGVACARQDTALFYKDEQESARVRRARVAAAKRICARCPFSSACLEAAMAEEHSGGARFGIRGGLTEEERTALQRKRTRQATREAAKAEAAAA